MRMNQAARALSLSLSCRQLSFFLFFRFLEPVLFSFSLHYTELQSKYPVLSLRHSQTMPRIVDDPTRAVCPSFEDPEWEFLRQSAVNAHQGDHP